MTNEQYQAENIRRVVVKVNRKTKPEIYDHIAKLDNIQGYILDLIEQDMSKAPKSSPALSNRFDHIDACETLSSISGQLTAIIRHQQAVLSNQQSPQIEQAAAVALLAQLKPICLDAVERMHTLVQRGRTFSDPHRFRVLPEFWAEWGIEDEAHAVLDGYMLANLATIRGASMRMLICQCEELDASGAPVTE